MILCIDYGQKNIGLAIASGSLAEPFENIKVTPKIYDTLFQISKRLEVEKIVIGISQGKMAEETNEFANKLGKIIKLPIIFQDESLSTKQAINKLAQTGSKKKQRSPKHSFAATLILQDYLDSQQSIEDNLTNNV